MTADLAMPPAETIEAVVRVILREHYKAASWAWGRRGWDNAVHAGRWSCACGASGDVNQGERATTLHREHVAKVTAAALRGGVE